MQGHKVTSNNDIVIVYDIESRIIDKSLEPIGINKPKDSVSIGAFGQRKINDLNEERISVPCFLSYTKMTYKQFLDCINNPIKCFDDYPLETILLDKTHSKELFSKIEKMVVDTKYHNTLLLAHNHNYDINGVIFSLFENDSNNTFYQSLNDLCLNNNCEITVLPKTEYEDKTISIARTIKPKKQIKFIDTMLILPTNSNRTLKHMGDIASRKYNKDFHKGTDYDYDKVVKTLNDWLPSKEELAYCSRDLQLCLFAYTNTLNSYKSSLEFYKNKVLGIDDLPITSTQLNKIVTDCEVVKSIMLETGLQPKCHTPIKDLYNTIQQSYKNKALDYNPPNEEIYNFLRKCSSGGIISYNVSTLNKICLNVGSMDCSSLYPATIGDFLFPCGDYKPMSKQQFVMYLQDIVLPISNILVNSLSYGYHRSIVNNTHKRGFMVKVKFKELSLKEYYDNKGIRQLISPLASGFASEFSSMVKMGNKIFNATDIVLTLDYLTLATTLAMFNFKGLDFIEGYSFRLGNPYKDIYSRFNVALDIKNNAKNIYKDIMKNYTIENVTKYANLVGKSDWIENFNNQNLNIENVAQWYSSQKVCVNSLYGITYQKLDNPKKIITDNGASMLPSEYDNERKVLYPIGSMIASLGRFKEVHAMLYFLNLGKTIVYAHTDSLKIVDLTPLDVENYNELIHNSQDLDSHNKPFCFRTRKDCNIGLYEFETENHYDMCICLGNMRLIGYTKNRVNGSHLHITMSGLNVAKAFINYEDMTLQEFIFTYLQSNTVYGLTDITINGVRTKLESGKSIIKYQYGGYYVPELNCNTMQSIVKENLVLFDEFNKQFINDKNNYKQLTNNNYCYPTDFNLYGERNYYE